MSRQSNIEAAGAEKQQQKKHANNEKVSVFNAAQKSALNIYRWSAVKQGTWSPIAVSAVTRWLATYKEINGGLGADQTECVFAGCKTRSVIRFFFLLLCNNARK